MKGDGSTEYQGEMEKYLGADDVDDAAVVVVDVAAVVVNVVDVAAVLVNDAGDVAIEGRGFIIEEGGATRRGDAE